MFCCCISWCKPHQVSPTESSTSHTNLKIDHKFIKLKHNKLIHLTHVNEKKANKEKPLNNDKINSDFVNINQPMRVEANSTTTNTQLEEDTKASNEDSNNIETFTNLLNSPNFKQRNQKYMCVKDGFEKLGFSILYKNKLKISTSNPVSSNLFNESRCALSNVNNRLPVLFYIHGVGM